MKNKSLFWYGVRAKIKQAVGVSIILIGFLLIALNSFLGFGVIVCGIVMTAKGHSQHYDFRRKGGHIIYNG
ncbi:MAG TPA: hypothetical protein VMZ91_00140 [Candidatus Paceibacterota bacterium]|nr:hypothetical protein [Candidatus Paceibacterota bacterium]